MSNIIKFNKYQEFKIINENVAAAKKYVAQAIQDGKIDAEFFDRSIPYSGYNTIIGALGKNLGFAYYFIKHYIDDIDKYNSVKQYIDEKVNQMLEKINFLRSKNKYNLNINDPKYINAPIEVFEKDLNTLYIYITRPGIVLDDNKDIQKSSLYSYLKSELDKTDYKVVIAVKKDVGTKKYVTDRTAIYYWASPAWCLKSDNYFSNYVKDNNYLQYIFIHKSVFNEVVESQTKGTNIPDIEKKVPINWESYKRTERLPGFVEFNPPTHRLGITTSPAESANVKQILDNTINVDTVPIDIFNDDNVSVNKRTALDLTNLTNIDVIVRQILKISNSIFDISHISIDALLKYAGIKTTIDFNSIVKQLAIDPEKTDELLIFAESIAKMYNKLIKNYYTSMQTNERLYNELIRQIKSNKNMFFLFQSFLYSLKHIPDDIMDEMISYYNEPINEEYKMYIPFSLIPIYLDMRYHKKMTNADLIKLIDEKIMMNFLLENTLDSFSFDYITAIEDDFKTILLTIADQVNPELSFNYPGLMSNTLTIGAYKMAADYISLFRPNLIKEYKTQYGWDKEIEFINTFIKDAAHENKELENFASEKVNFLLNKIYTQLETVMFIGSGLEVNSKLIKVEILRQLKTMYEKTDFNTNRYTPWQHNMQLLYCMQGFFANYEKGKEMYNNYFKGVL